MSDRLTLPLRDVPAYRPDGPVRVRHRAGNMAGIMLRIFDVDDTTRADVALADATVRMQRHDPADLSLVVDATGRASLARAIGAAVGLDVSGGVACSCRRDDVLGPVLVLGNGDEARAWARLPMGRRIVACPALADIDPNAEQATDRALCAVAREVLR